MSNQSPMLLNSQLEAYKRSSSILPSPKIARVQLSALPPLSLYVHIPWCIKKCPYCDFNSHAISVVDRLEIPETLYLAALQADLEQALPAIWGRPIQSIFIGGGTPSLLSAQALDSLLSMVRARVPLIADAEITLEANPGTFETEKFAAFAQLGVNRLSIGVQSFSPDHLKALGRVHDGEQALNAIQIAKKYFPRFNIDLMFALPQQTLTQALQDLELALSFYPSHLSLYHLTLEPNTVFAKYPPELPNEDSAADMHDALLNRLEQSGLERYEVSAFAIPGEQARHNLNYWRFGDYLGIGAGAHSKISFPNKILRQARLKQPEGYMQAVFKQQHIVEQRELSPGELPFEFMLNALRLKAGVPTRLFEERTGTRLVLAMPATDRAVKLGLLDPDPTQLRATAQGWRFLNDLQQIFLSDLTVQQP